VRGEARRRERERERERENGLVSGWVEWYNNEGYSYMLRKIVAVSGATRR